MEASKNQIRSLLLYEFNLGRGATEATQNVCAALGEGAVSLSTTQRWFAKFRQGNQDIEDQPRSGRPREIDREALLSHVEANPTKSTRILAADFDCSHMQIDNILREAGKTWRCSKWLPHDLTLAQRQRRVTIATQLLQQQQQRPFLERVLTSDEKWIPLDNIRPEKQWLSPGQNPVAVPKVDQRQNKVLLCVWWHRGGIVHYELLPNATIVTAAFYCEHWTGFKKNCAVGRPVGDAEQHRPSCMTTPGRTQQTSPARNWRSWAGKFSLTHHIPLTLHHQTTTFFGR